MKDEMKITKEKVEYTIKNSKEKKAVDLFKPIEVDQIEIFLDLFDTIRRTKRIRKDLVSFNFYCVTIEDLYDLIT